MCHQASLSSAPSDGAPRISATTASNVVPKTEISQAAFQLASSLLPTAILNHSIRVFLYAQTLAEASQSAYASDKQDLLFTACILHDIGTVSEYDGPQRFEVEGGDAAVQLLRAHNVSEANAHEVWTAIALHTSPGIAERISELARIVRIAVLVDFHRREDAIDKLDKLRGEYEGRFPRLNIEKVLGDAVVAQALKQPGKAPTASWPHNLLRAHLDHPGWDGVNKGF